jgi:hypothetical protein
MGFGEVLREFGVKIALDFDKKKIEAVRNNIDSLGAKLRHLSFEVAAAGASLFEMGNISSSNSRDLVQTSQILGINTTQFQRMAYAAKVAAGVGRGEFASMLGNINNVMDRARHGDQQAATAFLRIAQASHRTKQMMQALFDPTKNAADVMKELAIGINAIHKSNPMAAARLAQETMGSTKLIPLMLMKNGFKNLGNEAQKTGLILGPQFLRQGRQMDMMLTRIGLQLKNLTYVIGNQVLKKMWPLIISMRDFLLANKKLIVTNIAGFLKGMAAALLIGFKVFMQLVPVVKAFVHNMGGAQKVTKDIIEAFLALKAIGIASSIAQIVASFVALAPAIGALAAVGVAVTAFHDLYKVITTGSFKGTWIADLIAGVENLMGSIGFLKNILNWRNNIDKKTGAMFKNFGKFAESFGGSPAQMAAGAALAGGGPGPGPVVQHFNLHTTNNIAVPPGQSHEATAKMIAKSTQDAHSMMMIRARQSALRRRLY